MYLSELLACICKSCMPNFPGHAFMCSVAGRCLHRSPIVKVPSLSQALNLDQSLLVPHSISRSQHPMLHPSVLVPLSLPAFCVSLQMCVCSRCAPARLNDTLFVFTQMPTSLSSTCSAVHHMASYGTRLDTWPSGKQRNQFEHCCVHFTSCGQEPETKSAMQGNH